VDDEVSWRGSGPKGDRFASLAITGSSVSIVGENQNGVPSPGCGYRVYPSLRLLMLVGRRRKRRCSPTTRFYIQNHEIGLGRQGGRRHSAFRILGPYWQSPFSQRAPVGKGACRNISMDGRFSEWRAHLHRVPPNQNPNQLPILLLAGGPAYSFAVGRSGVWGRLPQQATGETDWGSLRRPCNKTPSLSQRHVWTAVHDSMVDATDYIARPWLRLCDSEIGGHLNISQMNSALR